MNRKIDIDYLKLDKIRFYFFVIAHSYKEAKGS